jgi:hypothetical protein
MMLTDETLAAMAELDSIEEACAVASRKRTTPVLWNATSATTDLEVTLKRAHHSIPVQLCHVSAEAAVVGLRPPDAPMLREMGSLSDGGWTLRMQPPRVGDRITTPVHPSRTAAWGEGLKVRLGLRIDVESRSSHLESLQRLLNQREVVRVRPPAGSPIFALLHRSPGGAPDMARVLDISQRGIGLALPIAMRGTFPLGGQIAVTFDLGTPARTISLRAAVARTWSVEAPTESRHRAAGIHCLGLSFKDSIVDDSYEDRLLGQYVVKRQLEIQRLERSNHTGTRQRRATNR